MLMLIAGLLLWSLVHLFPSLLPEVRTGLLKKPGEGPYKGIFALFLVGAILLMVFGWRSIEPQPLYAAPTEGLHLITMALVAAAFILIGAANVPTNVKRYLRHPMLTGVMVWGIAHLLANGDDRTTVLFGGLTIWAAIEMIAINRREGAWQKPDPVPVQKDVMLVVIGLVLTAAVAYFHESLSGVQIVAL